MNASTKAILLAAVMSTLTSFASAQYRVGNDGRSLDASNRIGSNGYNSGPTVGATGAVNGNQIVTGNVTGGREFRGNVGYGDPREFRGSTADVTSDRFIRGSSAAPYGGVRQDNANRTTAFYGSSRGVAPPAGFQQQGLNSGAYVPAPAPGRSSGDLRLGSVVATPQTILPQPGDLLLPGPVDPSAGNTMITASPLYGVRQWRDSVDSERQFVDRFGSDARPVSPDDVRMDRAEIVRIRTEMNDGVNPTDIGNQPKGDGLPSGTDLSKPQGIDNAAFATNSIDNKTLSANSLQGGLSTDQTTRQELLIAPAKQSALYAKLLKQFNDQGAALSDQEAHRRFELQRAVAGNDAEARETVLTKGDTDTGTEPKAPEGIAQLPIDPNAQPEAKAVAPIDVNNLAEGVRSKGLADLITAGQEAMKNGQFGAAIDRFDAAAKVAPNNSLITLGRAHAELGASYYGRAEADLRKAFGEAPELLVGRYSLVDFLGEERLAYIIKDLKAIASAEPQQAGPTFLLAYISRNMGNNDRAADYLTETEKRLGGPDDLIGTFRKVWNLPVGNEMK